MLESVGKYKIISEIARGGMGIVYRAEDTILRRTVAIKQLYLVDADEERIDEYRERFRREAILAANLNHPNIVSIFDVSITDEGAYYVMEFLKGISLGQELLKRPGNKMSVEEFFPIFKQVCKGLSYASKANLVHRDIKPDNIYLLPNGLAKITDFGIAFSRDRRLTRLTKPGSFLGTLCYMSPEQLEDSGSVDHRADIYSLAALSYEVLCGDLPFPPDVGMHRLMTAIVTKDPTPLYLVNPEISYDLSKVIARGMRKRPSDRYATAEEFEKEFENALTAPKRSRRPLLAASDGRSSGTLPSYSAQNAARQQVNLRNSGQDVGSADGRVSQRGPAKFFALTNSVPLVKYVGEINYTAEASKGKMDPVAICARKGRLIIADAATKSIKILGASGQLEAETHCSPSGKIGSKTNGGLFSKPSGVALDVLGKIYATDANDQYVRVYDNRGWFVREFLNKQGSTGENLGLLVDDVEGCIYLADPPKGSVHCVRSDLGTWMGTFGTKGINAGQLQRPFRMVLDGFGQIYVLDQDTCKISVFTKNGLFQRGFGSKGTTRGAFNTPGGLAIDQADRLYVADSLNNRVLVFNSAGDYLFVFGGPGSGKGQFRAPQDISVDLEQNKLYVLDRDNRRIQIFDIFMEENKNSKP